MHNRKLPEGNYEGDMAKAQLQKIEKYAKHLNEMIHPEDELEAWVQAKLSVIAAYIGDIKHYLEYELQESGEMGEEFRYGGGVSGVAEEIQLYYVTDADGDVKKIFENYQDASNFLRRTLKGNGDVREAIVDEDEWENEKINTYNIKNFGNGGMVMQKRQAARILGEDKWSKLSEKEKIKATKYLIAKGQIEEYEKAVRGTKIKDKYSYSEYRYPPSTNQEDMKEAEELLGKEKWNSFSSEEKKKVTEYLKAQGRIGFPGMEEDIETLSGMQYYKDGGEIRKIKGYNFSEQIENGRIFKELIQRVYDNQTGDYKYPLNFITQIARGKESIVKTDDTRKYYVKGYNGKGTLTHFEFLNDPNFIKALEYVDRPKIRKFDEGGNVDELEIEFEKENGRIMVEYSLKMGEDEIEISGRLIPYNTGRSEEMEFEPSYFTDEKSERYYDNNWERIEEQILNAYYTKK